MRFRAELGSTNLTVATALLLAMAVVVGYLESLILPAMPVPGMRLGLANIAVVFAISALGPRRALFVSVARVALVGIAVGTITGPAGMMSLVGAVASWSIMYLLSLEPGHFSVVGWSLGGAAIHGVSQLLAASLLTGSAAPLLLLPLTLGLSLAAGMVVGLTARLLISRMPTASVSFAGV